MNVEVLGTGLGATDVRYQELKILRPSIKRQILGQRLMDIFRTTVPSHYVPIHPDNVNKRDWLILLEVGTIVGHAARNVRVAKATLEKTIAKKYNIFSGKKYFVLLEDYDPQIHVLYFCPQLYKRDMEGNLIALEGEEIGELLVQAFRNGAVKRQVWYRPSDKLGIQPIIGKSTSIDLDTIIGNETIPKQGQYPPIETWGPH